jgi:diguanylate cyclase
MSARPTNLKNPAAIARLALMRLAQTATPPTPEHYARAYQRASGLPEGVWDAQHAAACASESTETLLSLVQTIRLTTTGLTHGIERFDGDLKSMIGAAGTISPENVRGLIEELAASRLALQKNLEDSRLELDATRQRLDDVTEELVRSRSQARIDPLTGAVNRRGMEEIVEREISRARRAATSLSLAVLDIDHFKRVNDEYGHDVGDQALIHLVTVITGGLRHSDVVCRFGGEEFAVILPGSGKQRGMFVVDQLRTMLEKAPMRVASRALQLCFSAGVTELTGDDDRDCLMKRADKAMFAAKRAGRNRVYLG